MKLHNPKHIRAQILALRKQAGMTLMEIIAALAIIAAVIVGALSLFSSASSSNQAVTMLKNVIAIRAAVQQLYLGQGGYVNAAAGDINSQLNNSRKAPSDLVWTGTAATGWTTSWGGTLSVGPVMATRAPTFNIVLTGVPPEICSQLVTNASNGWSAVVVGTTTVATTAAGGPTFPAAPATVNTACGTTTAGVTVTFTSIN